MQKSFEDVIARLRMMAADDNDLNDFVLLDTVPVDVKTQLNLADVISMTTQEYLDATNLAKSLDGFTILSADCSSKEIKISITPPLSERSFQKITPDKKQRSQSF